MENMTGPTEMLSKRPRVIPLSNTSSIIKMQIEYFYGDEANDNGKNYFITILICRRALIRLQIKTEIDHRSYKLVFICFYPALATFYTDGRA